MLHSHLVLVNHEHADIYGILIGYDNIPVLMGYYQCQYVFLPSFIGDDELTHFMETVLNQLAQ